MKMLAPLTLILFCIGCGSGGNTDGSSDGDGRNPWTWDQSSNPWDAGASELSGDDTGGKPGEDTTRGVDTIPDTGCGNGICDPGETPWSCAKDCQDTEVTAVFIFAHKGDEWTSLGRMHDLLSAGSPVVAIFLGMDDTPFDQVYNGQKQALALSKLGIQDERILLYETDSKGWPMILGIHRTIDRLTVHLTDIAPTEVYLPQLCGGDMETELAHAFSVWALKRAGLYNSIALYEYPTENTYHQLDAPDTALLSTNPNMFVDQVLNRHKLIPKDTEELKTTIGNQEMMVLNQAASAILNPWLVEARSQLTQDLFMYMVRMSQRYRALPTGQDLQERPYISSLVNPEGTFLYQQQGYTFDEYKQRVKLSQSFYGVNGLSDPLQLPFYQGPEEMYLKQAFTVTLYLRNISQEPDTISFLVGLDEIKAPTLDCEIPEPVELAGMAEISVQFPCKADEPKGPHVFYFRAVSQQAKDLFEPAKYAEIPFAFKVL